MESQIEWTNETVLEFLELYEKEPIIWNASHSLHKNRNAVYDAWLRIKDKLSVPYSVSDLKKKKESLMSSFRTCLQKIKQSNKSGAGVDEVYKPTWFAFECMARFLRNKDQPKEVINSEDIISQLDENSESETRSQLRESSSDETELNESKESDGEMLRKSAPTQLPSNRFKIPQTKKVKRYPEKEGSTETIHAQMQEAYSILKNKNKKDECDLYCDLLATKLRKMDEGTREIVMNKIDNLVFSTLMCTQSQCTKYSNEQMTNIVSPEDNSAYLHPHSPSLSHISSSHFSNESNYSHTETNLLISDNNEDQVENSQQSTAESTADLTVATFLSSFK